MTLKNAASQPPTPVAGGEEKDPQFAYTLARGLDVLRAFEGASPHLGNREIAVRTGIPRPTVARLTRTLTMLGYLKYDAATARFRLSVSMLSLAYPLLSQLGVRQIARPLMQRLADYANGAVSLGMRQGLNIILVDSCIAPNAVTARPDIGAARKIALTAVGRAYLAGIDEAARKELLAEIRASGDVDWKLFKRDVDRELERYRSDGFCIALHTSVQGTVVAAVPFRGAFDGELMVVNCAIAEFQADEAKLVKDIGPRLVGLVQQVERAQGSR